VLKGGEAVGLVVVLLSTSSTISTIMPITSPAVAPPETVSADEEGGVEGGSDAMVGYMVGPSLTTPPETGESEMVVGGGVGGSSDSAHEMPAKHNIPVGHSLPVGQAVPAEQLDMASS